MVSRVAFVGGTLIVWGGVSYQLHIIARAILIAETYVDAILEEFLLVKIHAGPQKLALMFRLCQLAFQY